ncbi:hypothetical protein [Sphingomonas sp.]|uniref:hypothetical protein n=1 Tax=Sphingomonas sp. TaxID=28214 RepID=UPI002DD6472A|nr:hypothetical protein [Sphingomonas sp.]
MNGRHPALRTGFLAIGALLIIVTPLVALLPGPSGIFTFAGGMALVLRNSSWARRQFARGKRRFPKTGHLADRALRRPSARRRRDRAAPR